MWLVVGRSHVRLRVWLILPDLRQLAYGRNQITAPLGEPRSVFDHSGRAQRSVATDSAIPWSLRVALALVFITGLRYYPL